MAATVGTARCVDCGAEGAGIYVSKPDPWWRRVLIWLHGYRWPWGPRPRLRESRGPLCPPCADFPELSASPYVGSYVRGYQDVIDEARKNHQWD